MRKTLLPLILILTLVVTPVALAKDKGHDRDDANTQANCDFNNKNHGSFVSCIAHLHLGGLFVSSAAKSDVGKKEDTDGDRDDDGGVATSPSPSASPSTSPSPSVSPSPSASPTVSPSPDVSPSPSASPSASPLTSNVTADVKLKVSGPVDAVAHFFQTLFASLGFSV